MSFAAKDLAAMAGVDPWQLRDNLAAGNPGEITSLAKGFAGAANDAQLAAELGAQATKQAGEGYTVDQKTVVNVEKNVADTKAQLGNSGEKMSRIARILDSISDDLQGRTNAAKSKVSELEGRIRGCQQGFVDWCNANLKRTPDQETTARNKYIGDAITAVKDIGGTVKKSIEDYEAALGRYLKSMADLGYFPPAALDEGPGDPTLSVGRAIQDTRTVKNGLGQEPCRNGLDCITVGSDTLAMLNDKAKAGVPLTAAERAYMDAWYNEVGSDNLAKLPKYVEQAAPHALNPGENAGQVYKRVLSPIADGIMHLSNPALGGHNGASEMPAAIKDLVNKQVGVVDPTEGVRYSGNNHGLNGWNFQGLDQYKGFTKLLESSSVNGGEHFTTDLGRSAIRVQQEANQIETNERAWLRRRQNTSGSNEVGQDVMARLDALDKHDSGSSTMLDVVSRNRDASQALMWDDNTRRQILATPWDREDGAAHVLDTATKRVQDNPAEAMQNASITKKIFAELSDDPKAWRELIPKGGAISNELTNIAGEYYRHLQHRQEHLYQWHA